MNNFKVTEILRSLNAYERNQFEKFIHSGFHNGHEKVRVLCLFLLRHLEDAHPPDRKKVFAAVFPRQPYDDARLRHVSSYLLATVEDFLVWKELDADRNQYNLYLVKALRRRGQESLFKSRWKEAEREEEQSGYGSPQGYFLHLEKYNATDTRTMEVQPLLERVNRELDLYFVYHKLRQACNILSHQRMFNADYRLTFMPEVEAYILQHQLDNQGAIALHYHAYRVLSGGGEEYFTRLRTELLSGAPLPADELRDLYLLTINYCITRLNKGEARFTREVFDIYRKGIENEVLFEKGELSPWTYKNIVAAGLKLEEISWTEAFINRCRDMVPEPYREGFFIYNTAKLHFVRRDYKRVAQLLHNAEIEDLFTHIDARVTLAKTYYETGAYEMLDYMLDNFGQLLRRRKMLAYHKENYSNFISYIRRLVNLKTYDERRRKKLAEDIRSASILTEREWLLQKL